MTVVIPVKTGIQFTQVFAWKESFAQQTLHAGFPIGVGDDRSVGVGVVRSRHC